MHVNKNSFIHTHTLAHTVFTHSHTYTCTVVRTHARKHLCQWPGQMIKYWNWCSFFLCDLTSYEERRHLLATKLVEHKRNYRTNTHVLYLQLQMGKKKCVCDRESSSYEHGTWKTDRNTYKHDHILQLCSYYAHTLHANNCFWQPTDLMTSPLFSALIVLLKMHYV